LEAEDIDSHRPAPPRIDSNEEDVPVRGRFPAGELARSG
jgi:hypothetical protein